MIIIIYQHKESGYSYTTMLRKSRHGVHIEIELDEYCTSTSSAYILWRMICLSMHPFSLVPIYFLSVQPVVWYGMVWFGSVRFGSDSKKEKQNNIIKENKTESSRSYRIDHFGGGESIRRFEHRRRKYMYNLKNI